jgi:flavin reductase (DIM6/NTAB) family NADH-FMN oxidoreductase RutF
MDEKSEFTGPFILGPLPVVLVACYHEKLGRNLLTIAWCGVSCSDPETIHISIRPERYSYKMIEESGCFTVNIPTRDLVEKVDLCGIVSGREGDKFERAGLTAAPARVVTAPLVADCPINIECTVRNIIPIGVHHVFMGEVVAKHARETILPGGRLDIANVPLVTYTNGEYWSLGERLGRYGCSAEKI